LREKERKRISDISEEGNMVLDREHVEDWMKGKSDLRWRAREIFKQNSPRA